MPLLNLSLVEKRLPIVSTPVNPSIAAADPIKRRATIPSRCAFIA
jgi:hypothetical protein